MAHTTIPNETGTSRRRLLVAAARAAVAAPIALAILTPGIALADGDHGDKDNHGRFNDNNNQGDNDGQAGDQDDQRGRFRFGNTAVVTRSAMILVPVGQVNGGIGGADFQTGNPGSDALAAGEIAVNESHQVLIRLRGAAPSSAYDVQFERMWDHGREDLGSVTTDAGGNFAGMAPSALGASNRAGAFVLIRGADEYVSVLA